ncbi:unnamed protein product [Closterium sp. NIES-53]
MVGAVCDARVVDTQEARLEDARRRHEANKYGPNLPLAVIEAGIRSMLATHVTAGGIALSYGYFEFMPDRILVTPLLDGRPDILTWKEAIEPQLEMARLIGFARGTVATLEEHYPDLRAEFRAVTDALYIGQLEEQLSHIRMGEEETATNYCNWVRRILATMRMAGMHYSTASYLTHIIKGLTRSYNLLKRLSLAPSTRATLNEDSLTSYILQDEAMQEVERPSELLAQANYVASVKQGGRPGQRGQSGGGGSSGWKPTKDADKKKSANDSGRGGGIRRRECWLCDNPDHLSFECPDRSDSDDENAKGGRERSGSRLPHQGTNQPRKEKQSTKSSTSAKDADSSSSGKRRDDKGASCSLVGVVEPTVSLAPEAAEDFQEMAAAVQANQAGCGTVALQGEAERQMLIPDVLYVPGVRASVLLAGQLKENSVKLQEDGDGMLLVSAAGDVLGRASYTGQVLCTDLRPCSAMSTTPTTEVVALWTIILVTKSTPDRLHARLAHVGMNTIRSSVKHEVATGLDLKSASGADLPCVSCIGGKLARHTFPDLGSDADDVLAVVHDHKTRYVWVRPVAKKSDAVQEFVQWLAVTERHTKKSVLMLRSDRGGEFLRKQFTDFVHGKGIVHDLTCTYTPQQNGMAEREMRPVVESVRTMLLHMGPGTTPYHLLTGKKPDLSLACVWGCTAQFLVPEQQGGGKLKPKARWGLHLGVSEESKGWELLDIADNQVVTTSDVVFYENILLEVWKLEHGPASGRTPTIPPTDTSTATLPLLVEVDEPAVEDVKVVPSPFPSPAPRAPPLVADLRGLPPMSASGDEGRSGASPVVPAKSTAGGRHDVHQVDVRVKSTPPGEEQAKEVQPMVDDEGSKAGDDGGDAKESTDSDMVEVQRRPRQSGPIRRPPDFYVPAAFTTAYDEVDDDLQYDDTEEDEDFPELDPDMHIDPEHHWDVSTMTVKEALASWKGKAVKATMEEEIRSLVGKGTWELVERSPGVNIMKNRWMMTTKHHIDDTVEREKARLVVKGFTKVYGADYDETYAPVSSYSQRSTERRSQVRIPVSALRASQCRGVSEVHCYVTLRIFLSIVAVLDLNLVQLNMKNAFLQSKLDQVLYMYQSDYFNDGTDRLDAGLRRRPARRQQQCSDAEGAEGAAKGRLRATGDIASAEVTLAGDRAQQVGEEAVATPAGLCRQAAYVDPRRGAEQAHSEDAGLGRRLCHTHLR